MSAGGANPAIRTLFYRLVRLLGLPIHPVFVFDGPNKPAFKRNKRSGKTDGTATAMAKRLIRLFGFVIHDAPGEAEAECALLQQRAVVDAVLSEDVDTIMFGCTRTLRNWSAVTAATALTAAAGNGSKGGATTTSAPTHVSMYDVDSLRQGESGLDREGMVLVALMSGGDYVPEGVPGCGVKLACEAAKAGFGRSLCRLKRADTAERASWLTGLKHELQTNASGFFRTRHHKLHIPEQFPSLEILRYYTHPVVSPAEVVERVRVDLEAVETADATAAMRGKRVDIPGLRDFAAETFDWTNRDGAVKFIRVLAPTLLARILLLRWSADGAGEVGGGWTSVVEGISKQRTHASTDETPELRVSFKPAAVVGLDLDAESDAPTAAFGRDGLALNSDDEFDEPPPTMPDAQGTATMAGPKKTAAAYDPTQADVAWVPRAIVEIGAPRALEAWDKKAQRPKAGAAKKKAGPSAERGRVRKAGADPSMPTGALDRFVQVTTKPGEDRGSSMKIKKAGAQQPATEVQGALEDCINVREEEEEEGRSSDLGGLQAVQAVQPKTPPKRRTGLRRQPPAANPWLLSGSLATPRITKQSASPSKLAKLVKPAAVEVVDLLSSPEEASQQVPAKKTSRADTAASPTRRPRKGTAPPPRQKSIRDFLAQPAAVVVLSDDEDGAEKDAGGRAGETATGPSSPPVVSIPLQTEESGGRKEKKKKTVYVPRRSAVGYFREETVDDDDDDGADEKMTPRGRQRRGWRKSEVGVVDLTGLDSNLRS